jgi:RNA polymerase II-associated factor 1
MIKFPDRPGFTGAERPSSPRLKRALLFPRDAEGQQEIDYFLPREEDVSRLDDVFGRAVDSGVLEQVQGLAEEDAADPRIDELLPVSSAR